MRDLDGSPRGRVAFDLAPLDREHRFIRASITHDQLELRAEDVIHYRGIDRHCRADPRPRQGDFVFLRVLESLHLGGLPGEYS